jgi:hypothetical protein
MALMAGISSSMMALNDTEHDGQGDKLPAGSDDRKDPKGKDRKPRKGEKDVSKIKQAGSYSCAFCVLLRVAAGEGIVQG